MPRPFEKRLYIASTEHLGTKVGVSGDPKLRIPELTKEGAGACILHYVSDFNYDVPTVESLLKRRFSTHRIKGEYFDVSPDDAIVEALALFAQMDTERQAERQAREESRLRRAAR